jgi:high-affinity iron transporter
MGVSNYFDFAVTTVFARECMEGAIIIGEFRAIIMRGEDNALAPGITKTKALSEVKLAAIGASAFALVVLLCVAIPLEVLSATFRSPTAEIIEGTSKIVAGISLLHVSLKLPKMLGVYGSHKKRPDTGEAGEASGLTLRSIRFNVAWNIWREVAECGVFLIPSFLSRKDLETIPLSAAIGSVVGLVLGLGIYIANMRLPNRRQLCTFAVLLIVILSAGLFTGGCHLVENEISPTKEVWSLSGKFWAVDRLPMTIFKPFGYNDSRTVLEIVCYWSWLTTSAVLHRRKYKISPMISTAPDTDEELSQENTQGPYTVEIGDGSGVEEHSLPSNDEASSEENAPEEEP